MVLVLIAPALAMIALAGLDLVLDEKARTRQRAIFEEAWRRLRPCGVTFSRR